MTRCGKVWTPTIHDLWLLLAEASVGEATILDFKGVSIQMVEYIRNGQGRRRRAVSGMQRIPQRRNWATRSEDAARSPEIGF
jgi:hypothetical protein